MEAGKQQAKPTIPNLPEIQPAFKNLDISQIMQGKTLTVGNLLEWQRSVIQAVENAKSNSVISIVPATSVTPVTQPPKVTRAPTSRTDTAVAIAENSFAGFKNVQQYIQQCNSDTPFQNETLVKKYVPTPKPIKVSSSNIPSVCEATSQPSLSTKVATVPVIRGGTTSTEKPPVPLVPNVQIPVSLANQAMLTSMISMIQSTINNNEEAVQPAKSTENVVRMISPEIVKMRSPEMVPLKSPENAPAKSPDLSHSLSQKVVATITIPSTSQTTTSTSVTTTTAAAAETSLSSTQQTPPKPLFKLSGRTLVTILPPGGSGDGKTTSSHKVFADDTFQPLDSFTVNTPEVGSPPAAAVADIAVLSPKPSTSQKTDSSSSDTSNVNKNNNNSAVVNIKQEAESVFTEDGSVRPAKKNKGKMSSRGRVIKTGATMYAENSDFEDDDVFLHNSYKHKSSAKSKRAASVKIEPESESDYDSTTTHTAPLYSVHMTSSGTWFHQVMWDGYRVTIMVPNKDDPYFTPPKDDPPVEFDGEPSSSHSSLWKGYAVLSEVRNKLFSSFSTAAVVSFRYRSGMETIRVPLLWVPILRNLGSLQENGPSAKVLRMDHLRYLCKHYELKFMEELNQVCQNKVKDTNRTVIELNDSKSDDLDYDKIPVCGFYCDYGGKKKKKSVQSLSAVPIQPSPLPRKHSRSGDERSSRQKLACMECQAVFFSDLTSCTYCDSELKKITPDQAKNCLNCGEMIRKRCRKCPFCHYNYGIFTFGRWLCNHCGRCNTARTPACLGCGVEKPAGKGGFTEDQVTPVKASRTSSKLCTSSTHSSPPRTTLESGTQSPVSGGSLEASPLGLPPKKKARRGITSVSQLPASDEVVPMDVSPNGDLSDTYLIRNIKWGSAADEVTVVVKIGGQCMVCFPEICEKIMLDHSAETLTKKVNTLKIKLLDGTSVMTKKRGLQTPHVHDTASRSCQLIPFQDLLVVLKAFNYKVPESFESSVTSMENEAFHTELKNEIQKCEDYRTTEDDYSEDKELFEYWTALHQTVDSDQIYQALTATLKQSNESLESINATTSVVDSQLEAIQNQQKAKRSLCEVLSSEIGFLRRRSLNIMEALVQINRSEFEEKTKCPE